MTNGKATVQPGQRVQGEQNFRLGSSETKLCAQDTIHQCSKVPKSEKLDTVHLWFVYIK